MYSFTIYGKSLSIRYLTIDILRTAYVSALMSSHRVRKEHGHDVEDDIFKCVSLNKGI